MSVRGNKLFQLINQLSIEEKDRLEKYINSPYFNENKRIILFCKMLIDSRWDLGLAKEKIFNKLFPEEVYTDERLRVFFSQFLKLTEQFLAYEVFGRDNFMKIYHSLTVCLERRLYKHFRALYRKAELHLDSPLQLKDINYYYYKFLLSEMNYQYAIFKERDQIDSTLYKLMNQYDIYFLANKLRYISSFTNQREIQNIEEKPILFYNEILKVVHERQYQNEELIHYYSLMFFCLIEPENETHFLKLKSLLLADKLTTVLTKEELRQILNMAVSYAVRKILEGNEVYYQYLHDLYLFFINQDAILSGGFIREQHYRNIIRSALQLNKEKWAFNFMNEYRDKLNESIRERVYHQNYFHYLAVIGQNKEADKKIGQLDFENNADLINYQVLLLKEYFNSDNKEAIESLVNNFRNWIRRNRKMTENAKEQLKGFFDYSIKIYRIKNNIDKKISTRKKQLRGIQLELRKTKIRDRKWLLEQVGILLISV